MRTNGTLLEYWAWQRSPLDFLFSFVALVVVDYSSICSHLYCSAPANVAPRAFAQGFHALVPNSQRSAIGRHLNALISTYLLCSWTLVTSRSKTGATVKKGKKSRSTAYWHVNKNSFREEGREKGMVAQREECVQAPGCLSSHLRCLQQIAQEVPGAWEHYFNTCLSISFYFSSRFYIPLSLKAVEIVFQISR